MVGVRWGCKVGEWWVSGGSVVGERWVRWVSGG